MELRQLEYAVVLADELHFGRAAARLHIVQSGLSQQLKKLEREVGVPLFSRSTHHVALTPAGEAFVEEARRILTSTQRLAVVARTAASECRELVIGIADAGLTDLDALTAMLRRRLPGASVREVDGGMPDLCRMLADDQLDLAVGLPVDDEALEVEVLRSDRLGAYLAESHPLAGRADIEVADLATEAVVLPPREVAHDFVELVEQVFDRAAVTLRLHGDSRATPASALQVVVRGEATLVIPRLTMLPAGVSWVPFSDSRAVHTWALVWKRGREDDPVLAAAVDLVRAHAREQGWQACTGADHSQ